MERLPSNFETHAVAALFLSLDAFRGKRLMGFRTLQVTALLGAISIGVLVQPSMGQTVGTSSSAQDAAVTITGKVAATSPNTLTVKTDNGLFIIFIFDRSTRKPSKIPTGSKVSIISTPTGESGLRLASDVTITAPPEPPPAVAATGTAERAAEKPYETGEAVPVSVRKLTNDIERQSRRFGFGFRTSVGLDPELILVGAQARIGPLFNRGISFRPNVDFGFGELTKMVAVDLNGVYRLPFNARQSRWSAFVGAGPCLAFTHRNLEVETRNIDFGDFEFQSGLNILTGVEFRSGMFVEIKSTLWTGPHLRMSVGYAF